MARLSVDGQKAMELQQCSPYRFGKSPHAELCIDNEKLEHIHGFVLWSHTGDVHLLSGAGKIFFNGKEVFGLKIDRSQANEFGFVELRFGEVEAKLHFEGVGNDEKAQDSSGYEDGKEKSTNTTVDSFIIPETQAPLVNTTAEGDSFVIPETQAQQTSAGELYIPETQDMLGDCSIKFASQQQSKKDKITDELCEPTRDEAESEFGSQFRINTQEFNEDDSTCDSNASVIIDDIMLAFHSSNKKQAAEPTDASDLEMSALNWSTSNSKCTVFNSTKRLTDCRKVEGQLPSDSLNLTTANENESDGENGRETCTPDLFDIIGNIEENQRLETCTPDLFNAPPYMPISAVFAENPEVSQSSSGKENNQPQLKTTSDIIAQGVQKAASLKNASTSISMGETQIQDFIATQPFYRAKTLSLSGTVGIENTTVAGIRQQFSSQDPVNISKEIIDKSSQLVESSAIRKQKIAQKEKSFVAVSQSSSCQSPDNTSSFIKNSSQLAETSAIEKQKFSQKEKSFIASRQQSSCQNPENISIFIENSTQLAETSAIAKQKISQTKIVEDFIATQRFPSSVSMADTTDKKKIQRKEQTSLQESLHNEANPLQVVSDRGRESMLCEHPQLENSQDFIATQCFRKQNYLPNVQETSSSGGASNIQDFIATQPFHCVRPLTVRPQIHSSAGTDVDEDMLETQIFVKPKFAVKSNIVIHDPLPDSPANSLDVDDDIDKVLKMLLTSDTSTLSLDYCDSKNIIDKHNSSICKSNQNKADSEQRSGKMLLITSDSVESEDESNPFLSHEYFANALYGDAVFPLVNLNDQQHTPIVEKSVVTESKKDPKTDSLFQGPSTSKGIELKQNLDSKQTTASNERKRSAPTAKESEIPQKPPKIWGRPKKKVIERSESAPPTAKPTEGTVLDTSSDTIKNNLRRRPNSAIALAKPYGDAVLVTSSDTMNDKRTHARTRSEFAAPVVKPSKATVPEAFDKKNLQKEPYLKKGSQSATAAKNPPDVAILETSNTGNDQKGFDAKSRPEAMSAAAQSSESAALEASDVENNKRPVERRRSHGKIKKVRNSDSLFQGPSTSKGIELKQNLESKQTTASNERKRSAPTAKESEIVSQLQEPPKKRGRPKKRQFEGSESAPPTAKPTEGTVLDTSSDTIKNNLRRRPNSAIALAKPSGDAVLVTSSGTINDKRTHAMTRSEFAAPVVKPSKATVPEAFDKKTIQKEPYLKKGSQSATAAKNPPDVAILETSNTGNDQKGFDAKSRPEAMSAAAQPSESAALEASDVENNKRPVEKRRSHGKIKKVRNSDSSSEESTTKRARQSREVTKKSTTPVARSNKNSEERSEKGDALDRVKEKAENVSMSTKSTNISGEKLTKTKQEGRSKKPKTSKTAEETGSQNMEKTKFKKDSMSRLKHAKNEKPDSASHLKSDDVEKSGKMASTKAMNVRERTENADEKKGDRKDIPEMQNTTSAPSNLRSTRLRTNDNSQTIKESAMEAELVSSSKYSQSKRLEREKDKQDAEPKTNSTQTRSKQHESIRQKVKSAEAVPSKPGTANSTTTRRRPLPAASKDQDEPPSKLRARKLEPIKTEPEESNRTRCQDSSAGPVQAINKYVQKIRSSGRKIKIALSMCDLLDLSSCLSAVKSVVEVPTNPLHSDITIMDKGERTYKFLLTVAANKPILNSTWLHAINKTRLTTVESHHIFSDKNFERKFKFCPLRIMEKPGLFAGYHFLLGDGINPNVTEMKAIIKNAAGVVHSTASQVSNDMKLYVVVASIDERSTHLSTHKNVKVIKTEGIMQALVCQDVEKLDRHQWR
ncbi:uncharacterized protein LOC115632133 isoform X2 [Scaptodrosophila lebanonensis]|uniref:Uncharacterized protein LOC115632133 isoform X2 n=1 Tax=Drosophila lebanonensis TaxID=7225 RepID=A0A6J2U9H9_DROLE|nr:uncharacterized protein LOC115632133 isoform X2 [Scaptodrosophila lebanonensis]